MYFKKVLILYIVLLIVPAAAQTQAIDLLKRIVAQNKIDTAFIARTLNRLLK